MRVRVQPYKQRSRGARAIARALGTLLVRTRNTRFRPVRGDVVVNWGSTKQLFNEFCYINHPMRVAQAADKLRSLQTFAHNGVNCPEFTTDRDMAQRWADEGSAVVVRHLTRANSGRGIELVQPGGDVPTAPLYTKYVKKYDEYRVHVVAGRVIDVQQKRRRRNVETDTQIRNGSNGWVFCRENVECPEVVAQAGGAAVVSLGLDFGGADVGFTRRGSVATVYEVNTAPGVEGSTTDSYREALGALVSDRSSGRVD